MSKIDVQPNTHIYVRLMRNIWVGERLCEVDVSDGSMGK